MSGALVTRGQPRHRGGCRPPRSRPLGLMWRSRIGRGRPKRRMRQPRLGGRRDDPSGSGRRGHARAVVVRAIAANGPLDGLVLNASVHGKEYCSTSRQGPTTACCASTCAPPASCSRRSRARSSVAELRGVIVVVISPVASPVGLNDKQGRAGGDRAPTGRWNCALWDQRQQDRAGPPRPTVTGNSASTRTRAPG